MSHQVEELREAASDLHTTARWMADDAAFTSTVEVLRELGEGLKGLSTVRECIRSSLGVDRGANEPRWRGTREDDAHVIQAQRGLGYRYRCGQGNRDCHLQSDGNGAH